MKGPWRYLPECAEARGCERLSQVESVDLPRQVHLFHLTSQFLEPLPAIALGGQLLFQLAKLLGLLSLTVFRRLELTGGSSALLGGAARLLPPPEIARAEADHDRDDCGDDRQPHRSAPLC